MFLLASCYYYKHIVCVINVPKVPHRRNQNDEVDRTPKNTKTPIRDFPENPTSTTGRQTKGIGFACFDTYTHPKQELTVNLNYN